MGAEINLSKFKNSKKAQVTIFIILGLIIIVLFAIIFVMKFKTTIKVDTMDENNPQASIETCVREATEDAIDRLSINGGDINPGFSTQYMNDRIVYLCYSSAYYKPCAFQRPLLVEHIESEITNFITPKVQACFLRLQQKLSGRDNVTNSEGIKITTSLYPKHVGIRIQKNFEIQRGDKKIKFNDFKINLVHPIYNFADIAMEIGNQQAKYCHFSSLGFMIMYPQYDVNETLTGDSDRIYVISERATNLKYQFATKSCPLPPGY